jgi:hypothetical protein
MRRRFRGNSAWLVGVLALAGVIAPACADPATPEMRPASSDEAAREAMCLMVESAAAAHGLPLEFFARVIWQESRFRPDAVGPVTRNGQRAQGVAQFMPGTASERRLLDPFDPVQALPKSAEYLSELRAQFGNLGLAAAAYNSGPRRVQEWLAGTGGLPAETRSYVLAVTGTPAEDWAAAGREAGAAERAPRPGCRDLMALLKQAPNPFVAGLEQHIRLGAAMAWGVQLAAGFSRERALTMYARAIKRLGEIVGDRDPSLLSSTFRSRGTRPFYQVRIGAETRTAADELCGRIRRAGQACLVLRNAGQEHSTR